MSVPSGGVIRERVGSPLSCALLTLAFDMCSILPDHASFCVCSSVRATGETAALVEGDWGDCYPGGWWLTNDGKARMALSRSSRTCKPCQGVFFYRQGVKWLFVSLASSTPTCPLECSPVTSWRWLGADSA